jgi:Tol biopolymer transport system component
MGFFVVFLALAAGLASAKKPDKPGGGDDPLTNPALAYVAKDQVCIVTSNGGSDAVLTRGKQAKEAPTWSPDGTQIAYLQEIDSGYIWRDLYIMDADGSNATHVHRWAQGVGGPKPFPQSGLEWLPDGSGILYSAVDIHVLDLGTGEVQSLGLNELHGETASLAGGDLGPDLEPSTDGYQGWLSYATHYPSGEDGDIFVVWLSTAQDGSLVADTDTVSSLSLSANQNYPAWSPDGATLAFLSETSIGMGNKLMVVEFDTTAGTFDQPTQVTSGSILASLAWSPDGSWIAFAAPGAGPYDWDLFRVRPDGTGSVNLTNSRKAAESAPDWNPAWNNDID